MSWARLRRKSCTAEEAEGTRPLRAQLMTTLLFVDMLGVKSLWTSGGRPDVETAFREFRALILGTLHSERSSDVLHGVVESDSVALVCRTAQVAFRVGQRLYRQAFDRHQQGGRRVWLHGVLCPWAAEGDLRTTNPIADAHPKIATIEYRSELLEAINAEKCGIKGMRLLVHNDLIDGPVRSGFSFRVGTHQFYAFSRLSHCPYPPTLQGNYQDFLWMASSDQYQQQRDASQIAASLRMSAQSQDEFLQAAATQVLFHEYAAIINSLRRRRSTTPTGARSGGRSPDRVGNRGGV